MNKTITALPAIKLVGITARTSNILEMNPETSKIGETMGKFFASGMQSQIFGRKNPGTVFAVYTHYESNEHGPYTYFLGEEVGSFENIPQGFETLTIPAQTYVKFTSTPGKMPTVCIDMWQNIWKMNAADLGGQRVYMADFEVYDHRCQNPEQAVLDIYIGVKQKSGTWVGETNITPLLLAFEKFERFRMNDRTEQERAGIIQAFEYCFELSWKIMKRLLEERGRIVNSPRETFRIAALEGFITDSEIWFDFLKKRNMTVHTYNQNEAEEVLSICTVFSSETKVFLSNIGVIL
jgi:nucleotidyltransferase substrate binding protein (TIGR01987 family)